MIASRAVGLLAALSIGCGSAEVETPPSEPPLEPPPPPSCADPLALVLPDGSCIRPGVPVDGCAEGFVHDDAYGCEPMLPREPCPPGLVALPGDATCRSLMACGAGRWGDIPVDAATIYVDASFTGNGNDGSEARPWTTVTDAIAAAEPGALIAIAQGNYSEDVVIMDAPVRLFGVCPEKVIIVATGQNPQGPCPPAAVCILTGASGSEVRGVSISGPSLGVVVAGSEEVLLDAVYVHDVDDYGVDLEPVLGATSITVRGSLIEKSRSIGVFVTGSEAMVEDTVVRATLPQLDNTTGWGLSAQLTCDAGAVTCDATAPARVTVRGSVIEQNHDFGMLVYGSEATLEGSVIRTTEPRASDMTRGRAMNIQLACTNSPTGPVCDADAPSRVVVRGSILEENHDLTMLIAGSEVTIEDSVVRATLTQASDQKHGRGLNVQVSCTETPTGLVCDPAAPSRLTLQRSLIEQHHESGIYVFGSEATIEDSVVRDSLPRETDQTYGNGLSIQVPCIDTPTGLACVLSVPSHATLKRSLVEQTHEAGLYIYDSEAIVESSVVRSTLPLVSDGLFGDGIAVLAELAPATATITNVRVDDSARAGIASFGGQISLVGSRIGCAAFALDGEPFGDNEFSFTDGGNNACGCPIADGECKVLSSGLAPPKPLTGAQ